MAWMLLVVAGVLEVVWATLMKVSDGFKVFWPTVGTVAAMVVSFVLLAQAMRVLPLGTAYAAWTGIGAIGASLVGIWLFGEEGTPLRLGFILLILVGIVGLNATARP